MSGLSIAAIDVARPYFTPQSPGPRAPRGTEAGAATGLPDKGWACDPDHIVPLLDQQRRRGRRAVTALEYLFYRQTTRKERVSRAPMKPGHPVSPNVRDAMVARGWTSTSWQAAGHFLDPYTDSFAGGYWSVNPYVSAEPPRVVVSAAAHGPPAHRESAHAPPPGPVQADTLAHALLTRWLAPLTANKAPAQSPLLVIGQSAWDSVAKTVEASAGRCYPTTCTPFLQALTLVLPIKRLITPFSSARAPLRQNRRGGVAQQRS